ncbi:MAG: hypothetical protein JO219_05480 [Candidatus Eremiobacteraeota bacterium]|nr:hypothetical protein [Candidatus Eremiobacteraeota bacterium]MBV8365278.1 hypothetical protein [Candidatus Eremiobacteraeota bacterium]
MIDEQDRTFLNALEHGAIANHAFRHRDHLRAAWLYIHERGPIAAERAMLETIARFASAHGHSAKFHHTLTAAWVRLVAAHVACHREARFDELIALDDRLLDKDLPLRFYSRELLFSEMARARWMEPDLQALPTS